ncbi:hypothetical protein DERF_003465 [Dermatophagoides farinae]|uniref:Neuroguidin n=1 Tax=Dermatophagoides farinae TaxID=6954 RepID=A0A922IES0_DERFA|nr:neuroguidin-A-like [Dermatophagoides farinae]KAH7642365.1 hypothetical protein HUG17_5410 [Dermatophagoides farinae]KAH9529588.1 hypothetical protein DERF_003465 [Dermatophagoides farinae]
MEDKDPISETNQLLNSFKESLIDCVWTSKKLLDRLKNDELSSESGISLFDLKNRIFVNYLIDLTGIVKHRLLGENNDKTRERLVEERVVLEKIQPLEEKLKYQVDNLMKTMSSNRMQIENNPLNARPTFSFDIEDENESETDQTKEDENEKDSSKEPQVDKNKVYVPPRLAQMKYEDEQERKARNLERAKKRAMNCSIINELRKEFDDAPEEEYDGLINRKSGIGKFLNRKKKYEEEHFIRLNLTKKQKAQARKLATVNSIADDVTKFDDISVLNIDNSTDFKPAKKKSKKFINRSNKKKRMKRF